MIRFFGMRRVIGLLIALFLAGCSGKAYFHPAGAPLPVEPPRFTLADWPYQEYWTGIVFNGEKIGFSQLALTPAAEQEGLFDIHSRAALRFRLTLVDKHINLTAHDRVGPDLSLRSFQYDYDLDGNLLSLVGRVEGKSLRVTLRSSGGQEEETVHPLAGPVYPASVLHLYPLLHGLEVGARHAYRIFDGETQRLADVTQTIDAFEESPLFPGPGFRMITELHGKEAKTWISPEGMPLLETSMGGAIIMGLEEERAARRYLVQAALNKSETLIEFSLIKPDRPIVEPRKRTDLSLAFTGLGVDLRIPSASGQACRSQGKETLCRMTTLDVHQAKAVADLTSEEREKWLKSTFRISAKNVRWLAGKITDGAWGARAKMGMLVEWMQANIAREAIDAFTATDVLARKKGACQGRSYLYAAFARSLGIPTRLVSGIVYSEMFPGFLYHTWAESYLAGRWVSVDPTLGQIPADATHVKFVEGEELADLVPLVDLVGRVKVRVIDAP